ncbi:MAG: hypothetical protein Kow0090_19120 [Myxococcota bacterium]
MGAPLGGVPPPSEGEGGVNGETGDGTPPPPSEGNTGAVLALGGEVEGTAGLPPPSEGAAPLDGGILSGLPPGIMGPTGFSGVTGPPPLRPCSCLSLKGVKSLAGGAVWRG